MATKKPDERLSHRRAASSSEPHDDTSPREIAEPSEPTIEDLISRIDMEDVVATAADAILLVALDGRILRWNAGAERLYGYQAEEVLGRSISGLCRPDCADEIPRILDRIGYGQVVREVESVRVRNDGRQIEVAMTVSPVKDASGRVVAALSVARDITELRQAESALRESREWLRMALRAARMVAWSGEPPHHLRASDNFAEIFGRPPVSTTGEILDLVHPDDRDRYQEAVDQALREGGPYNFDYRILRPDTNALVWLEGRGEVRRDRAGEGEPVIGVIVDITDRKRIEEQLRTSRERLRAIVETAADGILTIDRAGTIESFNPAAERLFGYAAQEVIGRNVKLLMPPPYRDEHDDYLRHYARTGEKKIIGIGREVVGLRKNGSTFPLELAVSEIDHLGLFAGIVHDITERKRLEKEVLEIAAEERRRIGQVLHDSTGQVLTGLSLMARVLADRLAARSSAEHAIASNIVDGIGQTLDQLRAIAKGLVPVEVDGDGLMLALDELAAQIDALHGLACRFECPELVAVRDNTTATHLYHIAQEATTNAIKHGQASRIGITLQRDDDHVILIIRDNGRGLPASLDEREGTGLRIMRYRAGLLGARLTIGPAKERGTLIRCTCPVDGPHD